jgi:hypothetical protein
VLAFLKAVTGFKPSEGGAFLRLSGTATTVPG